MYSALPPGQSKLKSKFSILVGDTVTLRGSLSFASLQLLLPNL